MKILLMNDYKDYEQSWPRYVQHAANAIIRTGECYAMMYIAKHQFYGFPGGGVEEGETLTDALIREVAEETGLIVKPHTIAEFGEAIEIRKDRKAADQIYERHDYYFTCDVEDFSAPPRLTENEIESSHQMHYVRIDEALAANYAHMRKGYRWTEDIVHILKLLQSEIYTN